MPAAFAIIYPVAVPAFAMDASLLLHVPPVVASVSVVEKPIHPAKEPAIAIGVGFTVIVVVAVHPDGKA